MFCVVHRRFFIVTAAAWFHAGSPCVSTSMPGTSGRSPTPCWWPGPFTAVTPPYLHHHPMSLALPLAVTPAPESLFEPAPLEVVPRPVWLVPLFNAKDTRPRPSSLPPPTSGVCSDLAFLKMAYRPVWLHQVNQGLCKLGCFRFAPGLLIVSPQYFTDQEPPSFPMYLRLISLTRDQEVSQHPVLVALPTDFFPFAEKSLRNFIMTIVIVANQLLLTCFCDLCDLTALPCTRHVRFRKGKK